MENFHLIKMDKGYSIAYHYLNSSLFEINDTVYGIIKALQEKQSVESLIEKHKLSFEQMQEFLIKLEQINNIQRDNNTKITENKRSIDRITIHVSNDCNLRCSYCYASGGSYTEDRKLMSEETALDIVRFFVRRFDTIGHIVFFGGEPLLNIPVIKMLCEEFLKAAETGELKQKPSFGIITNGTLLNDNIIALIKQYINTVTVSIDGPEEVNDKSRYFSDGKGSFKKIEKFIKTIKQETGVELLYEATLSKYHLEMNFTEAMLSDYFKMEFGLDGTIVPDMYEPAFNTGEYIDKSFFEQTDGQFYLSENFTNLLSGVVNNEQRSMCLVGDRIIAVSVDGEFFACHMNCGNPHLSMGSIYGENIIDQRDSYVKKYPFLEVLKKKEEPCVSCWARCLCGGCAMRWFFNEKEKVFHSFPDKDLCKQTKKSIENMLVQTLRLKKDPLKWEALLAYIKQHNGKEDAC